MRDKESLHKKIQEMIDCYATTDPLGEMPTVEKEKDLEEAALKWIGLAVLHGINRNAEKITLERTDNNLNILAEYRGTELPSVSMDIGDKIIDTLRAITYIEGEKGKSDLAVGVRDDSVMLEVKLKQDKGKTKAVLKFAK